MIFHIMDQPVILTDQTQIALIQKDISNIQSNILDIKTVLREGYATKDALVQVARETESRLNRLESSSNLWRWLSPTMSAALTAIVTFLIVNYLQHLH